MSNHRRLDWYSFLSWLEDSNTDDESLSNVNFGLNVVFLYIANNIVLLVILLGFFSYIRSKYPDIYSPKLNSPPRLPVHSWIFELWKIDEQQIIEYAGYDVLFFLRFYKLSFKIFATFSIYAWTVLIPINGTADGSCDSTFDLLTMTNISQGSRRLWFHVLGMYILFGITAYYLEIEYVIFSRHRHNYLKQRHAHLRTIFIEDIPKKLRTTVTLATYFETLYPNNVLHVRLCQDIEFLDRLVLERADLLIKLERALYYENFHKKRPTVRVGGMLEAVDAVSHYTRMIHTLNYTIKEEKKTAERLAYTADKLDGSDAISVIESLLHVTESGSIGKILEQQGISLATYSPKFNEEIMDRQENAYKRSTSIDNYLFSEWLFDLCASPSILECWEIVKRKLLCRESKDDEMALVNMTENEQYYLSKAFVTFKTFRAATIAKQVLHMQLPGQLTISGAPHPSDLLWHNLYITRTGKFLRKVIVVMTVYFLLLFWAVPVILVSFLTSVKAIQSFAPPLTQLCQQSALVSSIVELIEPCALILLMNVLPLFLNALAAFEGRISISSAEMKTFVRYYAFQVINVFLVTTISGSVLKNIVDVVRYPETALLVLGEAVPAMGGFFMAYGVLRAFAGLGFELTRVGDLLWLAARHCFCRPETPKDQASVHYVGNFSFASAYAKDAMFVLVCMTYACIAPLMLLAALSFFFIASMVYKYQLLYVYEPLYETGGIFWPKLSQRFVTALYFSQFSMIGMMVFKEFYNAIYPLVILIIITWAYSGRMTRLYIPIAERLPFDQAQSLDLDLQNYPDELEGAEEFVQPSLRAAAEELPVIDEKWTPNNPNI